MNEKIASATTEPHGAGEFPDHQSFWDRATLTSNMISKLLERLNHRAKGKPIRETPRLTALDDYVTTAPSLQNAVDIFEGEWSCRFPKEMDGKLTAGLVPAFQDPRMTWLLNAIPWVSAM